MLFLSGLHVPGLECVLTPVNCQHGVRLGAREGKLKDVGLVDCESHSAALDYYIDLRSQSSDSSGEGVALRDQFTSSSGFAVLNTAWFLRLGVYCGSF